MRVDQSFIIPIPNCRWCNRDVICFAFVATFWHNSIKKAGKNIHTDTFWYISVYVKVMEQLITSSPGLRNIRVYINCIVLWCEMDSVLRNTAFSMQMCGSGFHWNQIFCLLFLLHCHLYGETINGVWIKAFRGAVHSDNIFKMFVLILFLLHLFDTYISQLQVTITVHDLGSLQFTMARNKSPQCATSLPLLW
jgi:hypothetical protein